MEHSEIARALDAYANIDPPFVCWLSGDGDDQSLDYCRSCAETKVAEGSGDDISSSCGPYYGADSCLHCEDCGCVLDYTLSRHGALSELDHFEVSPPSAPLKHDTAFHLARMVEAVECVDDGDAILAIMKIGQSALELINADTTGQ